MYGAIIGDLAGSIYEYEQSKKISSIEVNELINNESFYSDDSILTIAIADAILHGEDYDKYLRYYINKYINYKPNYRPYFKSAFSPNLIKWANNKAGNNSIGNGAMMRISPVGFLFNSERDVVTNARLATIPSHNTKEAIDAATKVALAIYYFRNGNTKEEVFKKLNMLVKYKKFDKFNTTCNETIDNCFYAIYVANSFEEAIRKIISMGGDTDTNGAIVGSIAEAIYGIDNKLIEQAKEKIPNEFIKVLEKYR